MNSLQLRSVQASSISSATDLPHLFGLQRVMRVSSAGLRIPRVSSCLASETKQKADPSSSGKPVSKETKAVMETEGSVFVRTYARAPLVLKSGRGCKLYDVDGREYLDMTAGIAVNSLGHGDPDWVKAVIEQANTLTHVSNVFYSVPQVRAFWPWKGFYWLRQNLHLIVIYDRLYIRMLHLPGI